MFIERTSVGLDVHAWSVAAAAIDAATGEVVKQRPVATHEAVRLRFLQAWRRIR